MGLDNFLIGTLVVIGAIVLIGLLLTIPTYFLWNWIMPDVFGMNKITMIQALGITMLSGILFSNKTGSSKD